MSEMCEPCAYLSRDNPACHKCLDCDEVYCEKCSEDHGKFRAFRNHVVIVHEERKRETAGTNDTPNTGQQHLKEASGVDNNDALTEDINQSEIYETGAGINALYSGSDDLEVDKKIIYAGSDEFQDEPQYATVDDDGQPVNHFYIDVEDTPLSRATGISGKRCLLVVNQAKLSITISQNDVKMFGSSLKCVRRYGRLKPNVFMMEFGRACPYGDGPLRFYIKNGKELLMRLQETQKSHSARK